MSPISAINECYGIPGSPSFPLNSQELEFSSSARIYRLRKKKAKKVPLADFNFPPVEISNARLASSPVMEPLYIILFICYASYAYNRKSVVFAMPMLKEEGLDASYAGLIASCQNIAFSISKFLVGILSDRLNPNLIFASGLLISGFATLVFSTASSATAFCCLWFLNGLAQGCGWPACAKILAQRASPSEFGTLWSFLSASQNFALSLCPFISAFMIVNYGWRWSVFAAGLVTLSLLAFFLLSLPFLSSAPKTISPDKKSDDKKDEQSAVLTLFLDPYIMLLSISFMIVFGARTATVDWGQMYLIEEMSQSQYVASAFTSSLETGGFVGRLAGGYLTDWVIKKNLASSKKEIPSKAEQRMSVAFIFMFINIISIHLFKFAISEESSSFWITTVGVLMGISYYGPIAILGIVSSECVPASLSGASHAIVALFGNIGATLSGLPCSYIAKFYGWSTVFFMLEILTAATLLIMIKCRKLTPKVEKPKEE